MWGATVILAVQRATELFQSTLPVWGATYGNPPIIKKQIISIHAPRVGSDAAFDAISAQTKTFQSTLPVWGATCLRRLHGAEAEISIHAPRVGSDEMS